MVGLNVDTLYSLASIDLSAGPLVLSMPEMGDRYWLMQLIDAWNNVPAVPGSRTRGGRGGDFAIVGPGWAGKLPDGVSELRMPTNLGVIGGRTYVSGPDGLRRGARPPGPVSPRAVGGVGQRLDTAR